jgi:hypothetical protein
MLRQLGGRKARTVKHHPQLLRSSTMKVFAALALLARAQVRFALLPLC